MEFSKLSPLNLFRNCSLPSFGNLSTDTITRAAFKVARPSAMLTTLIGLAALSYLVYSRLTAPSSSSGSPQPPMPPQGNEVQASLKETPKHETQETSPIEEVLEKGPSEVPEVPKLTNPEKVPLVEDDVDDTIEGTELPNFENELSKPSSSSVRIEPATPSTSPKHGSELQAPESSGELKRISSSPGLLSAVNKALANTSYRVGPPSNVASPVRPQSSNG